MRQILFRSLLCFTYGYALRHLSLQWLSGSSPHSLQSPKYRCPGINDSCWHLPIFYWYNNCNNCFSAYQFSGSCLWLLLQKVHIFWKCGQSFVHICVDKDTDGTGIVCQSIVCASAYHNTGFLTGNLFNSIKLC